MSIIKINMFIIDCFDHYHDCMMQRLQVRCVKHDRTIVYGIDYKKNMTSTEELKTIFNTVLEQINE